MQDHREARERAVGPLALGTFVSGAPVSGPSLGSSILTFDLITGVRTGGGVGSLSSVRVGSGKRH